MRIRTPHSLFAFLLACLLLFCGLHAALVAGMRRIRSGMFGAFNRTAEGKVNADIVVTGSSRAAMAYDPAILKRATGLSAFNLGRIGALTNVHTGVLRFYLRHNRPPRVLIENVDLFSLNVTDTLYDLPQYTPYLSDPGLYEALRRRYPAIWKARYLPFYGYIAGDTQFDHYLGLEALFGIQPEEDCKDGYYPRPLEWNDRFARFKATHKKTFDFHPQPGGIRDFQDFLSEAQSRGIPTILVVSPLYHEYLAMLRGQAELMAIYAGLARRHGAIFWDLSDLPPISGSTSYFFDYEHLNQRGAAAFSEALGERLAAWLRREQL